MLQVENNWNNNQKFYLPIPSRDTDLVQLTEMNNWEWQTKIKFGRRPPAGSPCERDLPKQNVLRDRWISGKKKWQEHWLCLLLMLPILKRCSLSQHNNNICKAVDGFSSYLSVLVCSCSWGSVKADCSWSNIFSETWEISCTRFCVCVGRKKKPTKTKK